MNNREQDQPQLEYGLQPALDNSAVIKSSDLIRNGKELVIQHGNEIYRLRITKLGKLILTK